MASKEFTEQSVLNRTPLTHNKLEVMKGFSAFALCMAVTFLMVTCSRATSAQEPLRVEVKPQTVYLAGLPIVVRVDVVNTSREVQEIDVPAAPLSNLATVYARLRRPGAKENLDGQINRDHWARTEPLKRMSLKPGERASARVNLSAWFIYDLPIGQYLCQASYGSVQSEPYLITVAAPTHKNFDRERELYLAMVMFLGAKACLHEGIYGAAHSMFLAVANNHPHSEYARVSYYYVAVTTPKSEDKIEALNRFLENPPSNLPDLLDENYRPILGKSAIHQWLGRLYFESGNLKMAKEQFLKIPHPNTQVLTYLKKIETAPEISE
jgi:TolA-binding protein